MRTARIAAFLLGLVGHSSDSSLSWLADRLAAEVVQRAGAQPVEVLATLDRTGRGARVALDLDELLRARLSSPAGASPQSARLQVQPVLSESPGRLIVTARLVEQPSGRLVDVLSISSDADLERLSLAARPPVASSGAVDLIASSQTPPLPGRVLDLAFMGPDRLLVLRPDEVALYRWEDGSLQQLARRPLRGPLEPVRHPGGILRAVEREGAAWALTSGSPRAWLFALEGDELVEREEAAALPWPGSASGLRYRPGTNLIEVSLTGRDQGPLLDLEESGAAVDADGRLLLAGERSPALRVGPTLAALWPGYLAASSPSPPQARDSLLILERAAQDATGAARVVAELPVEGAVRAVAARPASSQTMRLIAAVETAPHGEMPETRLVLFELGPPTPARLQEAP